MKVYIEAKTNKVYFSVTYKLKRFYLYTGLQTTEKFKGMVFPKSDRSAKAKTATLARLYAQVEDYTLNHSGESVVEMKEHLKDLIVGEKRGSKTPFLDYLLKVAETKERYNTKRNYQRVARQVEEYDSSCSFVTIDKKWVKGYIAKQKERGRSLNGISTDLQILKATFTRAIDDELTDRYPFHGITIKKEQTMKRCLSIEQLRQLRDFKLTGKKAMYRDCFMLCFYLIGINISDLLFLRKEDYHGGRITYRRNKTGRLYDIRVEPEAQEIIERHKSRKKDFLLSFLEEGGTTTVNTFANNLTRHLRTIGEKKRHGYYVDTYPIESRITSYWSRHTWATIASEIDIPMEVIGRCLGHSLWDRAVTATYIKYDTKKIDDANRKVIDYLNSDLG